PRDRFRQPLREPLGDAEAGRRHAVPAAGDGEQSAAPPALTSTSPRWKSRGVSAMMPQFLQEGMMAKGILIAAMDFSAAPEDEFHDWYDLEHVPERLRVPGFLNADRWIGTENPKVSVATYDLDNVGVLHSPPYLAVGGENGSPWTKRTAKFRKSILRYEGEQLFPGDRTAPPDASALFMLGMNVAPEHEPESNECYNTEPIP